MDHSDRMHLFGEEGTDDGVNKLHLMYRNYKGSFRTLGQVVRRGDDRRVHALCREERVGSF